MTNTLADKRYWFSQTKRQESFSVAYIGAVVATAGFSIDKVTIDEDSVDVLVQQRGSLTDPDDFPQINILQIQLKCTYSSEQHPKPDGNIHFQLSRKNYNDLRRDSVSIPSILVVLYIPSGNEEDWILEKPTEMILRHKAHWVSLRGMSPLTTTQESKVVLVPTSKPFNVEELRSIMGRLATGGLP